MANRTLGDYLIGTKLFRRLMMVLFMSMTGDIAKVQGIASKFRF